MIQFSEEENVGLLKSSVKKEESENNSSELIYNRSSENYDKKGN